ncbi:hypothetical protein DPF_0818 [Desulfoplanes formicivorans]|uniref:Uncharacterized protein n=2 Tax=Desulfoplanes formicivorans TaxID=1592317 RepID=A0A194AFY1_9BACT|nr:hypothetical protein DPF_0818 [Desulfoplanes formicivorans]
MARVWPDKDQQYDEDWVSAVRKMNGLSSDTNGSTVRRPWRPTPWDKDPWESMHLWESERDYFNFAQYVPVI